MKPARRRRRLHAVPRALLPALLLSVAVCGHAGRAANPAPTAAQRVAVLAPNLAELVCAAGACAQLVAAVAYSDYPESVRALPRVGDGFSIHYESLLAQHPDLVLAWAGGTPPNVVARLRSLGLRVETVRVEHLDDIAGALQQLGVWLGHENAAQAAAAQMQMRLKALRQRWRAATPLRVVFQIGTAPAYVIGAASPIDEALRLCGGVNVFSDLAPAASPVGAEALLAAHPQAVVYGQGDDAAATLRDYWRRLPGAGTPALLGIPADLITRPTPRMLDGIQTLCEALDGTRARAAADPTVAPAVAPKSPDPR